MILILVLKSGLIFLFLDFWLKSELDRKGESEKGPLDLQKVSPRYQRTHLTKNHLKSLLLSTAPLNSITIKDFGFFDHFITNSLKTDSSSDIMVIDFSNCRLSVFDSQKHPHPLFLITTKPPQNGKSGRTPLHFKDFHTFTHFDQTLLPFNLPS